MYAITNNVLSQLKYDIGGGALALTAQPLAGAPPWNFPPAPTDAAVPTYGEPFGVLTLIDRLDSSAAKIEHAVYSARAAGVGADAGCFVYTFPAAAGRGQEGTAAQAWVAGAYIIQQPTKDYLAANTRLAMLRAGQLLVHARDGVLTWDGANFTFGTFIVAGAGRGRHWSSDGYLVITMPANGTVVKGFGGAADTAVAAGAIPLAAHHALYYEPYISGTFPSIAGNFKRVSITGDYVVPPHWIELAVHTQAVVVGEQTLRIANGETLTPWYVIGAGGFSPAFENAWVNYGAPHHPVAMRKRNGEVELRGLTKSGVVGNRAFLLPAGWRPAGGTLIQIALSNGAVGYVQVDTAGQVIPFGSNVYVQLYGVRFTPEQ
jgi:hypothetical protein